MNPVSFVVHGTPAPAGSKKGFYNAKAQRVVITDDSKRSRPWKAQVSDAAAQAMAVHDSRGEHAGYLAPLEGPLLLEVTFLVTRPKGHFGQGKNAAKVKGSAPRFPSVKPDLLKLARAIEDAMSGIVYRDDAQIVTEILQKAYGSPARCEVRVVPIDQTVVDPSHLLLRGEQSGSTPAQLAIVEPERGAA